MTTSMTWLLGASLTSITAYLVQRTVFKRNPAPLPPGPTPLPILGNLFDLPKERPWLTYTEWGKKFGTVLLGTMPEASVRRGTHILSQGTSFISRSSASTSSFLIPARPLSRCSTRRASSILTDLFFHLSVIFLVVNTVCPSFHMAKLSAKLANVSIA